LATVSLHTNVEAADVFVDDVLKGSTDSQKNLELHITPGSHVVRIEKQGYAPASQTINVSDTGASEVKFDLNPSNGASAQPKDSYLMISGPPNTAVKVDKSSRGAIPADGTLSVKVSPDTPHMIEMVHEGYKTWTVSKTVKAGERLGVASGMTTLPKVTIESFSANTPSIQAGQTVKIFWQTTNASDVTIAGIGANLQASGSQQVPLSQTTTFVLTAKGGGATETKSVTVTVAAAAPAPTVAFTANPSTIQAGENTTLTWQSQNATQVSISGMGQEQSSGSLQVSPTKTATYTIEAKGPGGSVTNMVTVLVQPKGPTLHGVENQEIRTALDSLQDAYATVSVDEMVKVWPSLSGDKKRRNGLNDLFRRVQALRVKYTDCGTPEISGDTAKISCTQSMTSTIGGKVQPSQVYPIKITLKKKSGSAWQIKELSGQ
jgi:plastocyanin